MSAESVRRARAEWKKLNPWQQFAKAFFVGATQFPQTVYTGVESLVTGKDFQKTLHRKLVRAEQAAQARVRRGDIGGFVVEDVLKSPAMTDVVYPGMVIGAAPAVVARAAPAVARAAPAAVKIVRGVPTLVKIAPAAAKISRAGKVIAPHAIKYGKPAAKFAAGTGVAIVTPEIAKAAVAHPGSPFLHPTIRKAYRDPLYEQAKIYAAQQIAEKQSKDPFYMQMAHMIPGGQIISTGDIGKKMRQYYTKMGVTSQNRIRIAQKAMEVERNIGGTWEALSAVGLSAGAETLGQAAVSRGLAKVAGKELTKKQAAKLVTRAAAKGIVPAGFYEGATVEAMQQLHREGKLTPWEVDMLGPVPIPGGIVGTGALGAGFAGLLGTGIARFSITRPKAGKVLQTLGYAIDPYEYPGDIFARVPQAALGVKGARLRIRAPVFAEVPAVSTKKKTISLTKQEKQAARGMGMTQQELLDIKRMHVMMQTSVPTTTPVTVPTPTFTPTPIDPFTPTPIDPFTPTPTETPTPTPTPTHTPTTIPVLTPIPRIFPPVPFMPGGGIGRGVSRAVGRRTIFYDEPAAAQQVMRSLL